MYKSKSAPDSYIYYRPPSRLLFFFFFNDTATTEIYTLSLHDALPISARLPARNPASPRSAAPAKPVRAPRWPRCWRPGSRSEEHTSELQSRPHLVCRLLLEKKKNGRDHMQHHRNLDRHRLLHVLLESN